MSYTEIKKVNGRRYYYRIKSVRVGTSFKKESIYLGVNLERNALKRLEKEADRKLNILDVALEPDELAFLEALQRDFSQEPEENYSNRYKAFCSLFVHDSTGIEGNTLTLLQTSHLLFDGIVPREKSLREVYEVINHKKALDFILDYKNDITREFILRLHALVTSNTLDDHLTSQIGKYRRVQVFVGRSVPPKPEDVPTKMAALIRWYSTNKRRLHPFILASFFHTQFERIHPFVDGTGRVGRLLMNFILHKRNYPMINIPKKKRLQYYRALQIAHHRGNVRPFILFVLGILKKSKLRF